MTSYSMDWKHRADAAFVPLRAVHRSWLPESLRQHAELLDAAGASTATRRILYAFLPQPTVSSDDIHVPAWASGGYEQQQRIVIRLGALACAVPLRLTIGRSDVEMLHRAIGAETYHEVTRLAEPIVRNDVSNEYDQALRSGDIAFFIAALGISVLETAAPQDSAFIQRHIRCQFAQKVWALRRRDLDCNRDPIEIILGSAEDV